MDLNQIELTPLVIADLYQKSIIHTTDKSANLQPEKSNVELISNTEWKYLGNNEKKILILLNNPDAMHLSGNELNFLMGILSACKLALSDVAIVNLNNHPGSSYKELLSSFNSKIVLLFNVEPLELGLPVNFPQYQLQSFANTSFLFSPSLTEIEKDKLQKSKLWVCLRRLFNV